MPQTLTPYIVGNYTNTGLSITKLGSHICRILFSHSHWLLLRFKQCNKEGRLNMIPTSSNSRHPPSLLTNYHKTVSFHDVAPITVQVNYLYLPSHMVYLYGGCTAIERGISYVLKVNTAIIIKLTSRLG